MTTKSMTGYGKATIQTNLGLLTTEIKSLNSKTFDLSLRLPSVLFNKDLELRTQLAQEINRGKISVFVHLEQNNDTQNALINQELAIQYYQQACEIAQKLGVQPSPNLLETVLALPNITQSHSADADEETWLQTKKCLNLAIENFNDFRVEEGTKLSEELLSYIENILLFLDKIVGEDQNRIAYIKEKIQKTIEEHVKKDQIDQNRFEQEIIYYLEKLDITEEKVRLKQHCDYFIKTLKTETQNGKKLGFIAQELNREMNTIGSKANNAQIQQWVVEMKNELEKIKEQTLNLL